MNLKHILEGLGIGLVTGVALGYFILNAPPVKPVEVQLRVIQEPVETLTVVAAVEGTERGVPYREMQLDVTAYCTGTVTKSGLDVDQGTLAVDPRVIPLGSVVHLEGVGYVVAIDTGGLVKGDRADLYVQSKEEAIKWGCREVKAKVFSFNKGRDDDV